MVQVILAGEKLAEDVSLGHLANRTEGFSGSDLRSLCSTAAMRPVRDLLQATGKSAQVCTGQPHCIPLEHIPPPASVLSNSYVLQSSYVGRFQCFAPSLGMPLCDHLMHATSSVAP